jgi:metallo-beta-lactamase class B
MSNLHPANWRSILFLSLLLALPAAARSQQPAFDYSAAQCPSCAVWNAPQKPLRIFGNTWYVGTKGLSAILITSPQGHVLIDGGIPASAPAIIANIRTLGFLVEDVRLIVNSHAHFDHAGGIAELQRASGADVAASPWSAGVFRAGQSGASDPQFGLLLPYAPIRDRLRTFADGETLRAGGISLTAHFTPGHTPGGTTWTWRSCDGDVCKDMVYADSQTPVSADGFFFTRSTTYPTAIADFERGFKVLENLSCDILITPHPSASNLWERVQAGTLVDSSACKRYAANARAALAKRVAKEQLP